MVCKNRAWNRFINKNSYVKENISQNTFRFRMSFSKKIELKEVHLTNGHKVILGEPQLDQFAPLPGSFSPLYSPPSVSILCSYRQCFAAASPSWGPTGNAAMRMSCSWPPSWRVGNVASSWTPGHCRLQSRPEWWGVAWSTEAATTAGRGCTEL